MLVTVDVFLIFVAGVIGQQGQKLVREFRTSQPDFGAKPKLVGPSKLKANPRAKVRSQRISILDSIPLLPTVQVKFSFTCFSFNPLSAYLWLEGPG